MLQEFKKFALRGNMIDLAIGIVIGAAFGRIITSLVNDIIMPLFGTILGRVNLTALKWVIRPAEGEIVELAVNYGLFLQAITDFFLIALSIFLILKALMAFKKKEEAKVEEVKPSNEEVLLSEIRDLLKTK